MRGGTRSQQQRTLFMRRNRPDLATISHYREVGGDMEAVANYIIDIDNMEHTEHDRNDLEIPTEYPRSGAWEVVRAYASERGDPPASIPRLGNSIRSRWPTGYKFNLHRGLGGRPGDIGDYSWVTPTEVYIRIPTGGTDAAAADDDGGYTDEEYTPDPRRAARRAVRREARLETMREAQVYNPDYIDDKIIIYLGIDRDGLLRDRRLVEYSPRIQWARRDLITRRDVSSGVGMAVDPEDDGMALEYSSDDDLSPDSDDSDVPGGGRGRQEAAAAALQPQSSGMGARRGLPPSDSDSDDYYDDY
jgi:hypothetical protein